MSSTRVVFVPSAVSAFRWLLLAAGLISLNAACSPGSKTGSLIVDDIGENLPDDGGNGGAPPVSPPPKENDLVDDPPPPGCGDAQRADDEQCDDGNTTAGDGCSANCLVVETGYTCDGVLCTLVELCGDARRVLGEGCDDGNADGGDGCTSSCQIEAGYDCPTPGELCVSNAVCGDGFVAFGESCDDANTGARDGCNAVCALEAGWECPQPGAICRPVCGDGLLTGNERCDDRNTAAGDGCAANCTLEPGFACDEPGAACRATVCGDGEAEGSEQCDDGNAVPYDGCTADCVNEPVCDFNGDVYECAAVCGDGMKFPEEQCDDGNNTIDDGCSPECEIEPGFDCVANAADLGDVLALPIIYRDFDTTHPQFEIDPLNSPRLPNIVLDQLGPGGKPVYNPAFVFEDQARPWTMDGAKPAASGAATLNAAQIAARFNEWYTDVPGVNETLIDTLDLAALPDGSFQFSATGANNQFFPIDDLGFGNEGIDGNGDARNFHFTSEVRQWFEFQGGELLQFTGDDDVWVFVNGLLTVDLGGIHGEIAGSIELSDDGTDSELCLQDNVALATVCSDLDVPVNALGVNEIVVFQAERHVTASNYTLTLRGFNAPVTSCESVCGDGIVTPDETCDDGPENGAGYGACSTTCTPGPRCGDGVVEAGIEQCDNGSNRDGYLVSDNACAPGCLTPSRCGDGVIDGSFGEQCDDGVNDGAYDGCAATCVLGPRCGDGDINGDEECDDGNRSNGDGCGVSCRIERGPA
jgi:fibro-slime domain-containing protein